MEGYKRRHEGACDNDHKRRYVRVQCRIWEKYLSAGSLQSRLRTVHGIDGTGSILVELVATSPRTYRLSFVHSSGYRRSKVTCPVEGYPYQTREAVNLRRYFFSRHHTASLHLEEDGNVPRFCHLYGVSVSMLSVQRGHVDSDRSKSNVRQTRQRERKQAAGQAQTRVFTIDGDELK